MDRCAGERAVNFTHETVTILRANAMTCQSKTVVLVEQSPSPLQYNLVDTRVAALSWRTCVIHLHFTMHAGRANAVPRR